MDYFERIIRKIEPHLKQDSDTEELEQFLSYLEKAKKSCADIPERRHVLARLTASPAADISKLRNIEAELEKASSKLQLFITTSHLLQFCDAADSQNEKLDKIFASLENGKAGVHIVEDKSVRPPSVPHGLTLQEDKNNLVLSWEPSEGIVDGYEVCYDERNACVKPVGMATTIKLESPCVRPGNVYGMNLKYVESTKGVREIGAIL